MFRGRQLENIDSRFYNWMLGQMDPWPLLHGLDLNEFGVFSSRFRFDWKLEESELSESLNSKRPNGRPVSNSSKNPPHEKLKRQKSLHPHGAQPPPPPPSLSSQSPTSKVTATATLSSSSPSSSDGGFSLEIRGFQSSYINPLSGAHILKCIVYDTVDISSYGDSPWPGTKKNGGFPSLIDIVPVKGQIYIFHVNRNNTKISLQETPKFRHYGAVCRFCSEVLIGTAYNKKSKKLAPPPTELICETCLCNIGSQRERKEYSPSSNVFFNQYRVNSGRTIIQMAEDYHFKELLETLSEVKKSKTTDKQKWTKKYADAPGSQGRTALMIAVEACNVQVFEALLDIGCDLSVKDSMNQNVLHKACSTPSTYYMVKKLLEKKFPSQNFLDAQDRFGRTPMMYASKAGILETVQILLDAGASTQLLDGGGKDAIAFALENDADDALINLLERSNRSR
eukprot:g5411.t1